MQFIYHWFWVDFWTPVWPNIAAVIPCGILGILWLDTKNEVRHAEQLREIRKQNGSSKLVYKIETTDVIERQDS